MLCKTDILVDTTKIFTASTRVANATRDGLLPWALLSLPMQLKCSPAVGSCMASRAHVRWDAITALLVDEGARLTGRFGYRLSDGHCSYVRKLLLLRKRRMWPWISCQWGAGHRACFSLIGASLSLPFIDMVLARAAGVDELISRVLLSGDSRTNVRRDGKKRVVCVALPRRLLAFFLLMFLEENRNKMSFLFTFSFHNHLLSSLNRHCRIRSIVTWLHISAQRTEAWCYSWKQAIEKPPSTKALLGAKTGWGCEQKKGAFLL